MALIDLAELGLADETLPLPIHGTVYEIPMVGARLGRALAKAASTGDLDRAILGDDTTADEYRLLLGEHYDTLINKLSAPEFAHVCVTVVTWIIAGREAAERVWSRDPRRALAAASSAGAPRSTASTSGTSSRTAPSPRRRARTRR